MEPSRHLNEAAEPDARRMLTRCCGSTRWVDRMLARRPFASDDELVHVAREEWFAVTPDDWREAFSQHPKIGDTAALRARFPETHALSSREQAAMESATGDVLDALERANRAYERRFGYIFIVCATGKSAAEMLRLLETRLQNHPADEILVAAGEQARITELRLRDLAPDPGVASRI